MKKPIRIAIAAVLGLAAFGVTLFLFVYTVFRFSYGYVRTDVFFIVAGILFVCTTFLVNVAWQAVWNRFFERVSN